jgi:OFA family oxalate/formate antiporter-like MFS transporter
MKKALPFRFSAGPNDIFYGWWILLACFIISIVTGAVTFFGFTAFFDPLVKEFGWSYTQISFALSLRGIEMSLLSPVVGFLVDRLGSRRIALWGVITVGIGFIMLSFTQELWMFYASIILIAFGGGGCTGVVMMHVITSWFQSKVGLALGIMTSGFGASGFLIPVIVWLIDDFGWRTAVIILGAGTWLIGIPLVFVIRNTPEECGLYPDGKKSDPLQTSIQERGDSGTNHICFADALKNRAFLFLALSEAIRMMVVAAVITHIMPYLNVLHVHRATAGLIAASLSVISILGRLGFGWLADLFDKPHTLAISMAMMSLGMFLLFYVDIWWVMILFLFLFPVGYGGGTSVRGALLGEYFGRAVFGRLIGLVMGIGAIGAMIGPTLTGFIFDATGSYYVAWIGLGIISCFSVVLVMNIGPKGEIAPLKR